MSSTKSKNVLYFILLLKKMENYYYEMDFNLESLGKGKLPDQGDYQTEHSMRDFEGQYEGYKFYENLAKNKTNLPNLIIDFNKKEYYKSRGLGVMVDEKKIKKYHKKIHLKEILKKIKEMEKPSDDLKDFLRNFKEKEDTYIIRKIEFNDKYELQPVYLIWKNNY